MDVKPPPGLNSQLSDLLEQLGRYPVTDPQITQVLVDEIRAQADLDGPRPQAFDTPFRHSDAGSCARRLGFKAMGVPESDPFDFGSSWVTFLGTTIHDAWQGAIQRMADEHAWKVETELPVQSDVASGHLDLLLVTDTQRICFELKTVNGFKFANAIGVDKSRYRRLNPKGPDPKHIIQTALNAEASQADLMVIGYLAMEAVSIKCAAVAGFGELDRILAEWTYQPEQFLPIAAAERERMRIIHQKALARVVPAPHIPEMGGDVTPNPLDRNPYWACTYCSHKTVCCDYTSRHGLEDDVLDGAERMF